MKETRGVIKLETAEEWRLDTVSKDSITITGSNGARYILTVTRERPYKTGIKTMLRYIRAFIWWGAYNIIPIMAWIWAIVMTYALTLTVL